MVAHDEDLPAKYLLYAVAFIVVIAAVAAGTFIPPCSLAPTVRMQFPEWATKKMERCHPGQLFISK
jgi:hypothetical protein